MKKSIITLFAFAALLVTFNAQAQKFPGPDASPMDAAYFPDQQPLDEVMGRPVKDLKIKIYYSRPQLKGRTMLGEKAAPFGQMWRLGANEANEITFYQDVTVGNTKVKAGTYTLFAIPNTDKWTFVLHSKLNTWGNYTLKDSKEIARVDGPVSKSDEPIEYLSMMFKEVAGGTHLMVGWENTIAEMPIKW